MMKLLSPSARVHTNSLIVLLAAALLTGCVSVKLNSNKDTGSVRKVERLFVLIRHGDLGKQKYSTELASALRTEFTNTPVALELSIASPLELDEKVHLEEIKQSESDAVLVIQFTGGVIADTGGYLTMLYDASLLDPQLEKRLWRAHIDNSGGTALMKKRFKKMAQEIVGQLRSDGFI